MRYEKEADILDDVSNYADEEVCLLTQSQLELDVISSIRDYRDNYADNSAHDALPPDFYSDKCNLMFDVMRVNDSEKRKSYNPIMRKERTLQKEIRETFADTNISERALTNGLVINAMPEEDYDKAHNYQQYLAQFTRVVKQHISKIPRWVEAHPTYKKGLFIFDETDLYLDYANAEDATKPWVEGEQVQLKGLHIPFLDERFMEVILGSELDFIIWALPYKLFSGGPYELPRLCIIDLSKYDKELFIQYDERCLRSR